MKINKIASFLLIGILLLFASCDQFGSLAGNRDDIWKGIKEDSNDEFQDYIVDLAGTAWGGTFDITISVLKYKNMYMEVTVPEDGRYEVHMTYEGYRQKYDEGSYYRNKNTAKLYSDDNPYTSYGTATINSPEQITIILNSYSAIPGTYRLSRRY